MARDMLSIPGELYLASLIQAACHVNIQYLQVLPSPLREYSQVVVTQSPSGALAFHADTIRILMLVKKRLHLARAQANAALRH